MDGFLDLARKLIPVVRAAGEVELKYYREDFAVTDKSDGSPVTRADQEAEALIERELGVIAPGIPVVGEEAAAQGRVTDISTGTFFLVDPLDGTREFITGGGDFTVNIALLKNCIPVMGIIYAPVADALYFGAEGQAFMLRAGEAERRMTVRAQPVEGLTVTASRRHGDAERLAAFLEGWPVRETVVRSSSLKFCIIAAGEADLYPRLGPTSEWDTAAGEAILTAAGGKIMDLKGQPLVYGKTDKRFLNPDFVAYGFYPAGIEDISGH